MQTTTTSFFPSHPHPQSQPQQINYHAVHRGGMYRRGPFRLFWFALGIGAATWYHRSQARAVEYSQAREYDHDGGHRHGWHDRRRWAYRSMGPPPNTREEGNKAPTGQLNPAQQSTGTPSAAQITPKDEYSGYDFHPPAPAPASSQPALVSQEQVEKVQLFAKDQLDGLIRMLQGLKANIPDSPPASPTPRTA